VAISDLKVDDCSWIIEKLYLILRRFGFSYSFIGENWKDGGCFQHT
jgi:hypothetical protein